MDAQTQAQSRQQPKQQRSGGERVEIEFQRQTATSTKEVNV